MLTTLTPRAAATTRTRIISDPDRLDALRLPWDALAGDFGPPTARHAWASACARAFHGPETLRLVVVLRDGGLVAVAALGLEDGRALEPLGMPELGAPAPFLYADDDALAALANALARLDEPVTMRRVATASPALNAIAVAYAPRGFLACTPAPQEHLGAAARALATELELPWARARAQELGDISFELVSPGRDDVDDLLALALGVQAPERRWAAFLASYAPAAAAAGTLRIAFLRIDGVPVATQIGVEHAGRLWFLTAGRLPAHAAWAPETLLLRECICEAASRGMGECRFVHGSSFGDDADSSVCVRAHPARGGRLAALTQLA